MSKRYMILFGHPVHRNEEVVLYTDSLDKIADVVANAYRYEDYDDGLEIFKWPMDSYQKYPDYTLDEEAAIDHFKNNIEIVEYVPVKIDSENLALEIGQKIVDLNNEYQRQMREQKERQEREQLEKLKKKYE